MCRCVAEFEKLTDTRLFDIAGHSEITPADVGLCSATRAFRAVNKENEHGQKL